MIPKIILCYNSYKNKIYQDLLNNYYSLMAPSVAVYLRINDWSDWTKNRNSKDIVFKRNNENRHKLDDKNLNNCTHPAAGEELEKLKPYQKQIESLNFKEIYDPKNFPSNGILSNYMGIPSFLTLNKSEL